MITHRTGFEYEGEVVTSYNLARLTPCSAGGQLLLEHSLEVAPSVETFQFTDYWGTRVHAFDVHVPHRRLAVTARSSVETSSAPAARSEPVGWDALAEPTVVDELCELLGPSPMTEPDEAIAAIAAQLRADRTPAAAFDAIVQWVRTEIRYERGVTNVETPASGVLATRRGVCQDFAHLTVALLRSAGIPARYVSGYLHPDGDAAVGDSVAGESHAWVEAWIGAWRSVDPTNNEPVGIRHIRVGHGRDYRDVAPLAGIYHGAPSKALIVSVELTRLA